MPAHAENNHLAWELATFERIRRSDWHGLLPYQTAAWTSQWNRLEHVIVFGEESLYRHLKLFVTYYHESRTHLSLDKDAPEPRPVQSADAGHIVSIPQVGGLHHRYERRAA